MHQIDIYIVNLSALGITTREAVEGWWEGFGSVFCSFPLPFLLPFLLLFCFFFCHFCTAFAHFSAHCLLPICSFLLPIYSLFAPILAHFFLTLLGRAEAQPRLEATMRAGSICLFHGFTLHRGAPITAVREGSSLSRGGSRDVLYYGFTKSW